MALQVGVVGATNTGALSRRLSKSPELPQEWALFVGRTLAEHECGLWTNGGEGMLAAVAAAYKEAGGRLWTVVLPKQPVRWPNYHVLPYADKADAVHWEETWDDANNAVVTIPTLCICMGLSAGTLGELSDAVWDVRFPSPRVNLKTLVAIPDLLIGGRLYPEYEELEPKVIYLASKEDLAPIIRALQ